MLHLQDAPTINPSRQTQPVAQDTLQNNSEGGACKTLGLVAVGHRLGVLRGNDCGGACSLAATKKQRQQKHNITNEVVLGRQSRRFTVVANCRRFGDMLAAFPSLWACDKKSPDELLEDIRKQIQAFGNAHGWARMGPNGEYLRPHVVRKLWFLLNSVQGIQQSDVEWQHWSLAKLRDLFPDMRGFVNNAPRHWTDIRQFISMAPEVPLSMHSCWTCLVGYATSDKYCGNPPEFAKQVSRFIAAGCEHETQAFVRAAFEAERERLSSSRKAPPTPLMVLRGLWDSQVLSTMALTAKIATTGVCHRIRGKMPISDSQEVRRKMCRRSVFARLSCVG